MTRTWHPGALRLIPLGAVLAVLAFVGCTESSEVTHPQSKQVISQGPATFLIEADDPCWDDPDVECHDDGDYVTYDNYSDDPTDASYWDDLECPSGCTTYPLGAATKRDILAELNNKINSNPGCSDVKAYVLQRVSNGDVRTYPNDDGNMGDIHSGIFHTNIHVYNKNFLPGNEYQLGMTLMHEGYHGFNNYYEDAPAPNNLAENFAASCVIP